MFLIRCSILNDVNADIEESQYYISQDLKILPSYLPCCVLQLNAFQMARLAEMRSHCKGRCLALLTITQETHTHKHTLKKSPKYKAINSHGSEGFKYAAGNQTST